MLGSQAGFLVAAPLMLAANVSGSGLAEDVLSYNGTVQLVKATFPAGSLGRRFARLRVW